MNTQEIPQDRWEQFFVDYTNAHEGEPISIELLDQDFGDQPLADGAPLLGISCDTKGSRQGSIEISAGEDPSSVMTHIIDHPTHVRVAGAGSAETIEIQAEGEPTALIRLVPEKDLPA